MPALALLDIAFIGLVGADPGHVAGQLAALDSRMAALKLPAADVATLVHHGETSSDLVTKLAVDGVVVAEITADHGKRTLRVVIYSASGTIVWLSEMPMTGRALQADDLEIIRKNLDEEIGDLVARAKRTAKPKVEPAVKAKVEPVAKAKVEPVAKPKVEPVAKTRVEPPAKKIAAAKVTGSLADPFASTPAPAPAPTPAPEAAPTTTAAANDDDAVSADEIEAMTSGGGASDSVSAAAPETSLASELHLRATAGLGFGGRSFSAPSAVTGYQSSAVGAAHLAAQVQPTARAWLGVSLDHSLGMTSEVGNAAAPTTMSRWEATAGYAVVHGRVEISPEIGLGRRGFSIMSTASARTPDDTYRYLILGAVAKAALGSRIHVEGLLAIEPVTGGLEPTEMAFGDATRWAMDLGVAVDVQATTHTFVRAAADYQRFDWSWAMAGNRGASGATDSYPSGSVSIGAHY